MDDEYTKNIKEGALRLGMVLMSLEDFAAQIIGHAQAGEPLDGSALIAIKERCVTNLKNSWTVGVPINTEAAAFNKAVDELRQLMDGAIAKSRHRGHY